MKQYLIVVECAIECDGKFLIIQRPAGKHAGGLLAFAGGKIGEEDETEAASFDMFRAGVRREILEELGLTLTEPLKYVTSEYFVDDFGIHVISNLFSYKFDSMPIVTPCPNEVPWYAWMTKQEIHNATNSPPWLKTLIEMI